MSEFGVRGNRLSRENLGYNRVLSYPICGNAKKVCSVRTLSDTSKRSLNLRFSLK